MERNNRFLGLVSYDDLTWILVILTHFCTSSAGDGTVKEYRNCAVRISNQ